MYDAFSLAELHFRLRGEIKACHNSLFSMGLGEAKQCDAKELFNTSSRDTTLKLLFF